MKITQFSVSRYRSIINAEKISFTQSTVLIGKNNEGKSNILRAISVATKAIGYYSVYGDEKRIRGRVSSALQRTRGFTFDWPSDFPIPLQNKNRNKKTRFRIDFSLDDSEVDEFYQEFSLKLNGILPISIEIGPSGDLELGIIKPGKGGVSFGKKTKEICGFIQKRMDFVYVPAVRTDRDAIQMVSDRLRAALHRIEMQPEYIKAVEEIQRAQKPILDQIARDVGGQLKKFIPSVKYITIDTSERRIFSSLSRDIELIIDDGVATQLDAKGDGIKSLVALSLFHSNPALGKSRIIAIEEPESHLHHGAVHELRRVLGDLSKDGQVIISTHNPSFVDRENLSSVILVEEGRAEKVKSIDRLRSSLGVLVSDNLSNSEFSIVCEGAYDARALRIIFSSLSNRLKTLIANGTIVFESLGGGAKLNYKLATLNRDVFRYFVVVDNDQEGRNAISAALKSGNLSDSDYSVLRVRGSAEAELEDAVDNKFYRSVILEKYGVDITDKSFGGNYKWSERMRRAFEASGKMWTAELENTLKEIVCSTLEERPAEKLRMEGVGLFRRMVGMIEAKFSQS